MKLSAQTLNVLKNFCGINVNMLVKPGKVLRTISPARNVFAKAELPDEFPQEFAIYDLNSFIATLTLFSDFEVDFAKDHATISANDASIKYYFASPSIVEGAPDKEIVMDETLFSFKMTPEDVAAITKVASVLNAPQISITSKKGKVTVTLNDRKESTSHSYNKVVGKSEIDFDVIIRVENFKLMAGNYTVEVAKKKDRGVLIFKCEDFPMTYWLTVETDSKV